MVVNKALFVFILCLTGEIGAAHLHATDSNIMLQPIEACTSISITPEMVKEYKDKNFNSYIAQKKREYQMLMGITNIPLIGNLASWGLQNLGGIDVAEAKTFLGRIFTAESEFNAIVNNLESTPENIQYLNAIFQNVSPDIISTKSSAGMITAMRKVRHPWVPTPKLMGEKDANNCYTMDNTKFLSFAACNLWAMHWIEKQPRVPKKLRRSNQNHLKKGSLRRIP